jgi:hypothetical protein
VNLDERFSSDSETYRTSDEDEAQNFAKLPHLMKEEVMKKPWLRCAAIVVFAAGSLVAVSPAAFADSGPSSSVSATTSVLPPMPDTGVIVREEPLEYGGTSYGEVELWYNSANREVEGEIVLDAPVTTWVAEVCLKVSGASDYETCAPLYGGYTQVTGWYTDAGITTSAWGMDDISSSSPPGYVQATGTTGYY